MIGIKNRLQEAHSKSQFIPTGNQTIYGDALDQINELEHERDQLLDQVVVQKKAIDALVKFGTTVAPSSSFWEEIWVQHEEALYATEPTSTPTDI